MIKRTLEQIASMIGLDSMKQRTELISGVAIDSRKVKKGNLFVPFQGENTDGHAYVASAIANGAGAALWQKDVPNPPADLPILLVDDTLEALQKLAESYLQQVSPKVVGVTGSNGKTTTKDMIASLLSQKYSVHKTEGNYNNHLGLPLTILGMTEETEVAVLEMGMSGRGEIELLSKLAKPDIAVITNIGEAHLLDLGSREGIAEAKLEITTGLKENGVMIYHGDEPLLHSKLSQSQWKTCSFGREQSNTIYPLTIESGQDQTTFSTNLYNEAFVLPVLGNHNVLNALAAILVARELEVDSSAIAKGLVDLKVTNMRMEMVDGKQGEKIINDAYNASPTSMKAAIDLVVELKGFGQKYLVLGDMLELGPDEIQFHRTIGESLKQGTIDQLFTFGTLAKYIAEGAKTVLGEDCVHAFLDKQALIQELKQRTQKNDLVLVKASRGMKLEEVVQELQK
ncbi:UDP-N-acetylmuramoyl-tripeptide--D-alanyl-D-alanine ligase [Bacillus massiliigorillae]|uniref:UDP-N-acetylmuramoyl-tripeptide--D-alanyl-D- alanine ligase n=1 Tax=Bacillus massiliigorillae TaxID=1243664 RepID=UPI00039F64CA|nr:UDP-N-acetylmuramoyl-tripeptide--D-alanyl-D-alanine ligase [Bacillus massiliigorillae]